MSKIGIMGGTFNPIHDGHIRIAQCALQQYHLNEIWFMPSNHPPHKLDHKLASNEHRKRMIQFAIDGCDRFVFSDFEYQRTGFTYTADTLKQLQEKAPENEYYFLIGGDSLVDFQTWYHPEEIVKYATILAAGRNGMSTGELERLCRENSELFGGHFFSITMPPLTVSSKEIRAMAAEGLDINTYCPPKVANYIAIHGLYGQSQKKIPGNIPEIKELLQCTLRPKRFYHTLGVADTAVLLAEAHQPELLKKAEIAGLLHDCAKYFSGMEMISMCNDAKIDLTPIELQNTALIHGKLGAYLATCRYGVNDPEILNAICYHTTGRPAMAPLEKIIYLADYIEPGRNMDCKPYSLCQIRRKAFENLDEALLMVLQNTITFLKTKKQAMDEQTIKTYQYYKQLMEEK